LDKLDFLDKAGDHMIRWGKLVGTYQSKHGQIGPEFENWLVDDIAKTKIPRRESSSESTYVTQPGSREPLPALGGPRSQAESVGVAPGGRPSIPYERPGPAAATPPPRVPPAAFNPGPGASMPVPGPSGMLAHAPPRGPYMSAEGKMVLPNDAIGRPDAVPLGVGLAGAGALGYGLPLAVGAVRAVPKIAKSIVSPGKAGQGPSALGEMGRIGGALGGYDLLRYFLGLGGH
jgi:hypothetical protein